MSRKFQFIRVPRTASTSIDVALHGKRITPHRTTLEWKKMLPNYDSLFTFGFCRNPYTRFISAFQYFKPEFAGYSSPNNFLLRTDLKEFSERSARTAFVVRPQSDFLTDGRKVMVKFLGRFERLKEDWTHIRSVIGSFPDLEKHRPTSGEFTLSTASKIKLAEFYAADFEIFGYDK